MSSVLTGRVKEALELEDVVTSTGRLALVLGEIIESASWGGNSKAVSEDYDLIKYIFLSFPLLPDTADQVLNALLFQFQEDINYLIRFYHDMITITELPDSIEFFHGRTERIVQRKKAGRRMSTVQPSKSETRPPAKLDYFEEFVEFCSPYIIRINVDNLKILAIHFGKRISELVRLVGKEVLT